MPVFTMPVILTIEADSAEEAQKAIDDWSEEVDINNDLPVGTEDINTSPDHETNDEGQRVIYLPVHDEVDEDLDSEESDEDDFNDLEGEL